MDGDTNLLVDVAEKIGKLQGQVEEGFRTQVAQGERMRDDLALVRQAQEDIRSRMTSVEARVGNLEQKMQQHQQHRETRANRALALLLYGGGWVIAVADTIIQVLVNRHRGG